MAATMLAAAGLSQTAYAAAGDLDTTFNGTGKVTTAIGFTNSAASVVVQPDGKIVAAGTADTTQFVFALTRYNTNGSLDAGFGIGGQVVTSFGSADASAAAVALQPDGKIVAAGNEQPFGQPSALAVARYNKDGSLDASFGTGGKVITSIGTNNDSATSVAIQSDGKIVVAANSFTGTLFVFGLVRYNTDGSLDSSFGTGGIVTTPIGVSNNSITQVVLIQPDGKIVIAGGTQPDPDTLLFAIARYNANGSLDTGFGTGGIATTPVGGTALGAALQPDGKVVAAGSVIVANQSVFALARYSQSGSLDSGFGVNGIVLTTPFGALDDFASSLAIQPYGKLVVAGHTTTMLGDALGYMFALASYDSNGSLDNSFGVGGKVTTNFASIRDEASAVAIQPDGNIVAGGLSSTSVSVYVLALARYLEGSTFGVTYNANAFIASGSVPVDGNPHAAGEHVTVLGNTGDAAFGTGALARAGYTFAGWNTAPDGSGTTYSAGATLIVPSSNVALYAQWAGTAIAPVLEAAVSRKMHGAVGTFDLPLSLVPSGVNHNPTTEPRQGAAQMVVLTFDKPINAATVSITEGIATAGAPTFNGNDVVVGLTGVTNQQYVTIGLTNVGSTDGGTGGSGSVRVGFLAGDVNQNRVVTVADLGLVNQQLAQVVTVANFLKDVNASGTLTVGDKGITNANLTKALPAP